jgi:hypothetical protein
MEKNHYMINMQRILFVASELHKRGYEKLRVEPSVSPNGMAWRCRFFVNSGEDKNYVIVSTWKQLEDEGIETTKTLQELTDLFEKENIDFLSKCKGKNQEYVKWFYEMLGKLQEGELPYAFSDYFSSDDYWETSLKSKIKTLPNEKDYYL